MVQWFALSPHSNGVPIAFYLITAGRGSRPPRPRIGKAIKRMDSKPAQGNDKFTSVLFFKKKVMYRIPWNILFILKVFRKVTIQHL